MPDVQYAYSQLADALGELKVSVDPTVLESYSRDASPFWLSTTSVSLVSLVAESLPTSVFIGGLSGEGVKGLYPNVALKLAEKRVMEAAETGAEVLATACLFCKHSLSEAASALNSLLQVLDVVELAQRALEAKLTAVEEASKPPELTPAEKLATSKRTQRCLTP